MLRHESEDEPNAAKYLRKVNENKGLCNSEVLKLAGNAIALSAIDLLAGSKP